MNVVHTQGAQVLITPHSHKKVGKTPFIMRCWGKPTSEWLVIFTDLLTTRSDLQQLRLLCSKYSDTNSRSRCRERKITLCAKSQLNSIVAVAHVVSLTHPSTDVTQRCL